MNLIERIFSNSTSMKQYLVLLDRVIGDSKTLNKREFEKEYKGKDIMSMREVVEAYKKLLCS